MIYIPYSSDDIYKQIAKTAAVAAAKKKNEIFIGVRLMCNYHQRDPIWRGCGGTSSKKKRQKK